MNRPHVVGQPTTSKHFKLGIDRMADLLAPTLGPTGGHIASERDTGQKVELLDNAATVTRRILSFGSPQEDIGAMVMRSLTWRVSQKAGDGSVTAAVIARALYIDGLRLMTAGVNTVRMEVGVKKAMRIVSDAVFAQAKPVTGEDLLSSVARTITREDELSVVLGEMSYLLGQDANILIEKYVAPYLEREYIAGAHYKAKISSMYFYSDAKRKRAVLTAPAIALVNDQLNTLEQALPILEAALQIGAKSLVIVVKDLSGPALNLLVSNHRAKKEQKKLDIMAVKLQVIGDEMRWGWEDLATLTGATILSADMGRGPNGARTTDLGNAQRVEYASEGLMVVANKEARASIQDEVTKLRAFIDETPLDDEDRPKHVRRLSTLTGGVGRLKVGADSKLHREMLHKHAERSLQVLSSAQRKGVVPGGGAALVHAGTVLRAAIDESNGNIGADELIGMQLIERMLAAPMKQIVTNAGRDIPSIIVNRVQEAGEAATYDALTGIVADAYESGVLDAADVVVTSFNTAVSGAMMALTTDAIVYHKEPEQSLQP